MDTKTQQAGAQGPSQRCIRHKFRPLSFSAPIVKTVSTATLHLHILCDVPRMLQRVIFSGGAHPGPASQNCLHFYTHLPMYRNARNLTLRLPTEPKLCQRPIHCFLLTCPLAFLSFPCKKLYVSPPGVFLLCPLDKSRRKHKACLYHTLQNSIRQTSQGHLYIPTQCFLWKSCVVGIKTTILI